MKQTKIFVHVCLLNDSDFVSFPVIQARHLTSKSTPLCNAIVKVNELFIFITVEICISCHLFSFKSHISITARSFFVSNTSEFYLYYLDK